MRDRMPEQAAQPQLDAAAYERLAETGGTKKPGAMIKLAAIAVAVVLLGGAVALTANNKHEIPQTQQLAAADPKQVEPQQLTATPQPASPAVAPERLAKADAPKPAPRARTAAPAPRPIEAPASAVTPPPAEVIPEIAPAPTEIAPEAAAPPLAQ